MIQVQGHHGDDGEERGVKKTKQSLAEICQKHADLRAYSSELTQKGLRSGGTWGSQKIANFFVP